MSSIRVLVLGADIARQLRPWERRSESALTDRYWHVTDDDLILLPGAQPHVEGPQTGGGTQEEVAECESDMAASRGRGALPSQALLQDVDWGDWSRTPGLRVWAGGAIENAVWHSWDGQFPVVYPEPGFSPAGTWLDLGTRDGLHRWVAHKVRELPGDTLVTVLSMHV